MRTATKKMFDRWKDIFNGNVELLHGDIAIEFLAQPEEEQEANISDRLALARQLINPITVATADQLVTAALKYHSFETVYLTAAYSQIVVDEIQSFDPQAMAIIVTFLKDIHELGGRFLLMTATLPPFIQDELKKLGNVETLDPLGDKDCPAAHNMEMKRHKYSWHKSKAINDGDSIKKIISSFEDESIEKVLVLCNTVSIAQDIFTKINIALKGEVISVNLLHSKFTRSARKQKEEKITGDARVQGERDGNRVIWVSTQIVEASLDLDFDMLHTEISTIDSLSQRFGRVWRTRAYDGVNPNIFIYDNVNVGNIENYTIKIYDRELLGITKRYLDSFAMKLLSEKDKHKMFNQIFGELDEDGRYRKRYNEMLKLLKNGFKVENRGEAQEKLRESGMFTYNLITKKYREAAEELFKHLENTKGRERLDLQAQIMDLCVPATVKKGVRSALEPLAEIYPKYFFAKSIYFAGVPFNYDDTIGLTYDNKFGSDSAIFI
jgi:CRISPR-associated endonuclease/helicase Cas3